MEIYHLYDSSEYTSYSELKDMNFLIIYKNKAITNINANTIDEIKKKIESDQSKKSRYFKWKYTNRFSKYF